MKDFLKKGFALSLGMVVLTKEQVEKFVNQVASSGEGRASEAKELASELIEKGETQKKALEDEIREYVKKFLVEFHIASKEDLLQLEQRIAKLEQKQ